MSRIESRLVFREAYAFEGPLGDAFSRMRIERAFATANDAGVFEALAQSEARLKEKHPDVVSPVRFVFGQKGNITVGTEGILTTGIGWDFAPLPVSPHEADFEIGDTLGYTGVQILIDQGSIGLKGAAHLIGFIIPTEGMQSSVLRPRFRTLLDSVLEFPGQFQVPSGQKNPGVRVDRK